MILYVLQPEFTLYGHKGVTREFGRTKTPFFLNVLIFCSMPFILDIIRDLSLFRILHKKVLEASRSILQSNGCSPGED